MRGELGRLREGFVAPLVAALLVMGCGEDLGAPRFFADQTYDIAGEELALIGTSEQTLVAYHTDEVLDAGDLPLCYTAFTP